MDWIKYVVVVKRSMRSNRECGGSCCCFSVRYVLVVFSFIVLFEGGTAFHRKGQVRSLSNDEAVTPVADFMIRTAFLGLTEQFEASTHAYPPRYEASESGSGYGGRRRFSTGTPSR